MSDGCSYAEYARHRGVGRTAVTEAVRSGRLKESIDTSGKRPRIIDIALADKEWEENTDFTRAPGASSIGSEARFSLQEEAAREKHWRAKLAELDYKERSGELVPVAEVEARFHDEVTRAKTKLLGVPTRIRQRLPHLTANDIRVIDEIQRESLEDLARDDDD